MTSTLLPAALPLKGQTMKGDKGGQCNRTACTSGQPATWYNKSTRAYYCPRCAHRINRLNGEICVPSDAPDKRESHETR